MAENHKKNNMPFYQFSAARFAKTLVLMTTLMASVSLVANADPRHSTRIINGERVGFNEADFFVTLLEEYNWGSGSTFNPVCGGAHVGGGRILTAAHCVDDFISGVNYYFVLGDTSDDIHFEYCFRDKTSASYECVTDRYGVPDPNLYKSTGYIAYDGDPSAMYAFTAEDVRVHQLYEHGKYPYDIAVIEVTEAALEPAAQLPSGNDFDYISSLNAASTLVSVGFGDTDPDENVVALSSDLLKVELDAKTDSYCKQHDGLRLNFDSGTMICAEGLSGEDTCGGDSGGPLFSHNDQVLYGITSFGAELCGSAPGVYTEVFSYLYWIEYNIPVPINSVDPVEQPVEPTNNTPEVSKRKSGALSWVLSLLVLSGLVTKRRVILG